MPRTLKTYQTTSGFFELAIAAPSMKAALEAWGGRPDDFHKGFAWESKERQVVHATMQNPGVVLRRSVGSKDAFTETASLPKSLPITAAPEKHEGRKSLKKPVSKRASNKKQHEASAAYAKREKRLAVQRQREESSLARKRKKQQRILDAVDAEFDRETKLHERKVAAIDKERERADQRAADEEQRWLKIKDRLDKARRHAAKPI